MTTVVRIRPPTTLDGAFLRRVVFPHLLAQAGDEEARVAFYVHGKEPFTTTIDLGTGTVTDFVRPDAHIAMAFEEEDLMSVLSGRLAGRDLLPSIVLVSRASSLVRFAGFLRRASLTMPLRNGAEAASSGGAGAVAPTIDERRRALALYLALENLAAFLQRLASFQQAILPDDRRVRIDHGHVIVTADDGDCFAGEASIADG
jgi:hypothetical protein